MKTYLKTAIVVLGLGLLCFLGNKVVAKINYKSKITQTLKTIPEFSFETINGESFTQNDINTDMATVFIYFNSECEFCQYEATSIKENIDQFTNIQLIFVSFETKEAIQIFINQYKLNNYDNITFLSDPRGDFSERFDATTIPYVLIYDRDQKLVKKHKGQLSINNILASLK